MKTKFILFSAMLLTFGGLQAQWFNNLNDIYWNNNVGIGLVFNNSTEPPTQTLDVDGTVRIRSLSLPAQQDNTLERVLVSDTNGNLYWRQDTTLDTDTQLSEAEVDGYVSNNGYAPLSNPNFTGNVTTDGNINITSNNALELGNGSVKEGNAGKIAYQRFSNALDIVGAGTQAFNRKIKFWAEGGSIFNGDVKIESNDALELGSGSVKEGNAGKIAYQRFSNALDIVGAGTQASNRKIKFWAEGGSIFNGSAAKPGGGSWTNASDRRLKQDITPFTDGLEKIQQIKPVSYRYNGKAGLPTKEQYVGIIAQEMQEVAPYTIGTFNYEDEDGNTTEYLDYNGSAVTYMLINAVKEQQQQIEAEQQKNEQLKERIEALESLMTNTGETTAIKDGSAQSKTNLSDGFVLRQNIPNPFDKTTTIEAVVPESVQQAKIVVYNLQGLELESYDLDKRGNVSLEITAGRFPSGMYLYALMADGQLIDTKKMVLTR